jgi:iron complex transport system ATP-binding protein
MNQLRGMRLQAKGISLRYNTCPVLDNVDFEIGPGELVGLIGPNGAGKTTLLKILADLKKPESGTLLLNDQPFSALNKKELAQNLAYLEQDAPAHWPLTVERVVELGRLPYQNPWQSLTDQDREIIEQAMVTADVNLLRNRTVTTLSGGERLRVMLARIFATQPEMILADEPIAALDPYHQLHTMELLKQHCERGGSCVVVLHDLNMAARFCDRLALLNLGQLVQDSTPAELMSSKQLEKVYGIKAECIEGENGLYVIPTERVKWD